MTPTSMITLFGIVPYQCVIVVVIAIFEMILVMIENMVLKEKLGA